MAITLCRGKQIFLIAATDGWRSVSQKKKKISRIHVVMSRSMAAQIELLSSEISPLGTHSHLHSSVSRIVRTKSYKNRRLIF